VENLLESFQAVDSIGGHFFADTFFYDCPQRFSLISVTLWKVVTYVLRTLCPDLSGHPLRTLPALFRGQCPRVRERKEKRGKERIID
jgi:hypothetical protein